MKLGDQTYKNHLGGYNRMALLEGIRWSEGGHKHAVNHEAAAVPHKLIVLVTG